MNETFVARNGYWVQVGSLRGFKVIDISRHVPGELNRPMTIALDADSEAALREYFDATSERPDES